MSQAVRTCAPSARRDVVADAATPLSAQAANASPISAVSESVSPTAATSVQVSPPALS
jgi:hypothetical protein